MRDPDALIADLRMYMAWNVPAGLALKALSHAMTELPSDARGSSWLIRRAAHILWERR